MLFIFNCQMYFKDFNERLVYYSYIDFYSIYLTQTFLLHFLHSLCSKFTSGFIFLVFEEFLLTILLEQICWQEIILIIFHFCIWYKFWHRILGSFFLFVWGFFVCFFQCLKNVVTSFWPHSFWWEIYSHSNHCSLVSDFSGCFQVSFLSL